NLVKFVSAVNNFLKFVFSMIPKVCFPSVRCGNLEKPEPLVNHFLKVFFRRQEFFQLIAQLPYMIIAALLSDLDFIVAPRS
ncbi:hypothetical protein D0S45_21055, partial [Marinifilum sp. JC120]